MRNLSNTNHPSSSFVWLDSSSFPHPSTIFLIQQHLSYHLPPELVDLILSYAEFWAHSTTRLDEPVRAFGPFTWGWRDGNHIDYLNVWCPSGPGYAHLWNRWGESRRDDSFLLRTGPIGVKEAVEDEGRGWWSSRYLQRSRLVRFILSMYQKGAAVAGLTMRCRPYEKRKKKEGRGTTNGNFPSSRTAAVRKVVFETWSHQDYFGAVGDSTADDDDDGAQQFARVFCDVSINRKRDVTPRARWKARILRLRQRGNAISISNNNNNNDDNKVNKKSGRHGTLVSYKPFILENTDTPRYYFPRYHTNTWRWDDTTPSTPLSDHQSFPTAQEFLRQLEVGDTIGVWGRVGKGETYHIIDAMRMHVFWAV